MDKEKPFSIKDQEIINEYNKKRNKEITKERLNNIEKLRKDFKKEVINEYKEKLINYLNLCIEMDNKRLKMKHYNEDWIKGSIEQVQVVINVIKSGVLIMTRCIICQSLTENTTGICDSPHHNSFNKAKFIKYLENKIENDGYRSASNDAIYYSLIQKINNGEFD